MGDFSAIQFVTSGLSLVAFLAMIVAVVILRLNDKTLEMIKSAAPERSAQIVDDYLNRKNVDVNKLTKVQ